MKLFPLAMASIFWIASGSYVHAQVDDESSVYLPLKNGAIQTLPAPGSAWPDLDGKLLKYEYNNFGGFQIHFRDQKVKWRGFVGAFEDVVAEVDVVASKVADGIYFMSSPTVGDSGDNVVINTIDMSVSGHLGADKDFDMIGGRIHCFDTPDCEIPEGEPMERMRVMFQLFINAWASGFWSPAGMMERVRDPGSAPEADKVGKQELSGKTFAYETPEGLVKVSVDGDQTVSVVGDAAPETSPTYTTKIAEGIYYLSWHGKPSGNHVVLNTHNMKVYDQILPNGTRTEAIYSVTCFGSDC